MNTETIITQQLPFVYRPLIKKLHNLNYGSLELKLPNLPLLRFEGIKQGPVARIQLHKPFSCLRRLWLRGVLGFSESYLAGEWSTDDLSTCLTVLANNEKSLGMSKGFRSAKFFSRLFHLLRRNSKAGSKKNISFHYDLGNDFYAGWLDKSMTYSAALFEHPQQDLYSAQQAKYQRLLDNLDAKPGQHILEIGCGWGGFAEMAAKQGYHVTGLTLSKEQLAFAQQRLAKQGLTNKTDLRLQDYRDTHQQYDHVVSIEMFEAVGEAYWQSYFETLQRCLKPGGRASIQVITIDAQRFERYRSQTDFIQRYIFPGGMLPSIEIMENLSHEHGFTITDKATFSLDYAETLKHWLNDFSDYQKTAPAPYADEQFKRLWEYYLAYCEAGFRAKHIDLLQITLEK